MPLFRRSTADTFSVPCPTCEKQALDALANRFTPQEGYWTVNVGVEQCAVCRASTWFPILSTTEYQLQFTDKEWAALTASVQTQAWTEAKDSVRNGALTMTALSVADAKCPVIRHAVLTIGPYSAAEIASSRIPRETCLPCCWARPKTWEWYHHPELLFGGWGLWGEPERLSTCSTRTGSSTPTSTPQDGQPTTTVPTADDSGKPQAQSPEHSPSTSPSPSATRKAAWIREAIVKARDGSVSMYSTASPLTVPSPPELLTYRRGQPVFGCNFETGKSVDQVRAIKLAPGKARVFYANSIENYISAIYWRVLQKQQNKFCPTKEDVRRVSMMVDDLKEKVFTRKAVRYAMQKLCGLIGVKSAKWGEQRFMNSLVNLLRQHEPRFEVKGNVKNEPYKPGKPPRPLHADGDEGQIMAGVVLWVLEDIMFHKYEAYSIKHRGKEEAMRDACRHLSLKAGQEVIETDGSAWDATMSKELRDLIENPVVDHVTALLIELGWPYPPQWAKAHGKVNRQQSLKVTVGRGIARVKAQIPAIRRSGHRGTSSLNWLINFVLSTCAVIETPSRTKFGGHGFLDPTTKWGVDRWGKRRMFSWIGEGDDGTSSTWPKLLDAQVDDVKSFWTRMGVNCELVRCSKIAGFVGWKIYLEDGLPVWDYTGPDLPRTLQNSAYTTSPAVIEEQSLGRGDRIRNQVGAASMMAYAAMVQRVSPSLAAMFARWSAAYGEFDAAHLSRDEKMKLGASTYDPSCSDWAKEAETLDRLGLVRREHYPSFVRTVNAVELDSPDSVVDELFLDYISA